MKKRNSIFLIIISGFLVILTYSNIVTSSENDNQMYLDNTLHIDTKEIFSNQFKDDIWESIYVREYPNGDWDSYLSVEVGTEVQFQVEILSNLLLGHQFAFSVVQLPMKNNMPVFDYVEDSAWWSLTYLLGASDTEVVWCFPHIGFLIQKTMRFNAIVSQPGSSTIDLSIFSLLPDTTNDPTTDYVTVYGQNDPPNQPTSPSGSSSGYRNQSMTYTSQASDPEGNNIRYLFDWGDGNTQWTNYVASGVPVSMSHTWSKPGLYEIRVKGQDIYGYDGSWSQKKVVIIYNHVPNTPTLGPPSNGQIFDIFPGYVNIDLTATSYDPDGDRIRYQFWDADSGTIIHTTDWLPYYKSGTISWQHLSPGTYHWYSKVQDSYLNWSSQSVTFSFTIQDMQVPPYPPRDPIPQNGSTTININTNLIWVGGDPNSNDSVTYDVYFGTTNQPLKVSNNQTSTIYDPGHLNCNDTYYWKIVSWDNHGASTGGRLWNFMTAENTPPNAPSNPNPKNNTIDVPININLSWFCNDPENDSLTFDIYLEANDSTPDILVSDNQTEMKYNPDLLYNTIYYWKVIVADQMGAVTPGPIWKFITEGEPQADLFCEGNLNWVDVNPGATVSGVFTVENIGDPQTLLNWEIIQWPTWGNWSFEPLNGANLSTEDPLVIVQVSVIAPNSQNEQFNGEIRVVNSENPSDYCIIDVSLATPLSQQIYSQRLFRPYPYFHNFNILMKNNMEE